ncbi:uncharacterized protein BDV17DRAFT_292879 [Aspergillus undulatus]|uniref:uncharacterized protein n=1 Tax=Aspergillus undulatus TaxID=1810928 RepID=UPI003CCE3E60
MCHRISWYHALCLHQDHASTLNICCRDALHCNYDCGNLEEWSLPKLGACPTCTIRATFTKNVPRKSQPMSIPPIEETFEDETLIKSDEAYFSGTNSEDSVDGLELFDKITF